MNPYLSSSKDSFSKRKQILHIDQKPKKEHIKLLSKKISTLHGNYSGYYGYRTDDRLSLFEMEWFQQKSVLDIGCNAGSISLEIAEKFDPKSVEGVDIDPSLIQKARRIQSIKKSRYGQSSETLDYFPLSCPLQLGTIPSHAPKNEMNPFERVYFRCGDWVHEDDPSITKYDVILALSITKWIHLNNGDGGLRYFFNKCFKYLEKGGIFILEPQPFEGYSKRAALSSHLRDNYMDIEFYPRDFVKFLTQKVGFKLIDTLYTKNDKKGFQRSIFIFKKVH